MQYLLTQIERYFQHTLGITVVIASWAGGRRVPFFLQDRYRFFEAQLMGLPCLFMVDKDEQEKPPATISKHIDQVQAKGDKPVIYVRERITAYNRKRLIEQKVPFVVPGNQMYLPMLGVDFREHFRKLQPAKRGLSPSTQAVLIHAMLQSAEGLSPTALADKLGYSVMTMSRSLDELEAAGLGKSFASGRERCLHFGERKQDVWKKAQPLLRTPVKSLHTIEIVRGKAIPGPQSGLNALAHYSMLAEPQNVVVALSREEWKSLQQKDAVTAAMAEDPNGMIVEVWSYAPMLFATDGWIDRLSLYLSLRDMKDERVQAALDQIMEEISW